MNNTRTRQLLRILFIVATIIMFLGISNITPLIAADDTENSDMDLSLKEFMKERKAEMALLSELNISASAGFAGHTAGVKNLYQLGLGLAVAKDMYPGEFRFRMNTSLVIQDSALVEHFTTLGMSYEHYLTPWLETYGFVERISNTFLSISYRYEIGGGFKAEFNVLPNKWQKKRNANQYILDSYEKFIQYLDQKASKEKNKVKENEILYLEKQLDDLKNQEKGIMAMAKKKRSLLTLGMALSVFSELEKSEYLLVDERQFFRFSFRPSFIFRPSRMISVKGQFYFKYPLFKKNNPNDPQHYRTDTTIAASLNLSEGASWTKNVSLVFEYKRHYDNNPFGLRDLNPDGSLIVEIANLIDTHDEFLIKLNVEF
jgi:hypothetical protein